MPCSLDLLDRRIDRREVEGHGLLAERGEPGARSQLERARVRRRRRGDHESVDGGHQIRGRRCQGDPELDRQAPRTRRVGVAHRDGRDARERRQRAYVHGPDAAGADDADAERGRPRCARSGLHQ